MIVLLDGEHHPSVVRDAVEPARPRRGGVVRRRGEGAARGARRPGRALRHRVRPGRAARGCAAAARAEGATTVVDLADEPVLAAGAKLRLASLALHLGLAYETATESFDPPRYERLDFGGPRRSP